MSEVTEEIISPEISIITVHPVIGDVHSDSKKEKYEEQAAETAVRFFEDNSFQEIGEFNISVTDSSDDPRQNTPEVTYEQFQNSIETEVEINPATQNVTTEPKPAMQANQVQNIEELNVNSEPSTADEPDILNLHSQELQDKPHSENWRALNFQNRMKGKAYIGSRKSQERTSKVTKCPRQMGPRCNSEHRGSASKPQCNEISDEQRKNIFESFWANMNWHDRRLYVGTNVDMIDTRGQSGSRRKNTFIYYLKIQNQRIQVCKEMFLSTLNIGEWSVYNWIKLSNDAGIQARITKFPSRARKFASSGTSGSFLDCLPTMPSHYCRKDTSKIYLEPVFVNFEGLYKEYMVYCGEQNLEAGSRTTLKKEMNSRNISLYKPRKTSVTFAACMKRATYLKQTTRITGSKRKWHNLKNLKTSS